MDRDDTVFADLSRLSTITLDYTDERVEQFTINSGVRNTLQHISRSLENGDFSAGFKTAVFKNNGETVGVMYIEDWRPQCFTTDVLDAGETAMSEKRAEKKEQRLDTLTEETEYTKDWEHLVNTYDAMDGGGEFGQTQFLAIRPNTL